VLTIEKSLLDTFSIYLHTYKISNDDGIIVAFSGGADSLALLSLLATIHPKNRIKAVYVNHLLRSEDELDREIEINRDNCKSIDVEFCLIKVEKGEIEKLSVMRKNGIEEAARHIRYKKLEEFRIFSSFSYIATAHTHDDQNETLLMRMFQGSRLNFASPIEEKHELLIRPLLNIKRAHIEEYLKVKKLNWVEDSTNRSTDYLRNNIRHTLIPVINQVFPSWDKGLRRVSDEVAQLSEYVDEKAKEVASNVIRINSSSDEVNIDVKVLSQNSPPIIRRVLYIAYNRLPFETPIRLPSKSVDDIVQAIKDKRNCRLDVTNSTIIISLDELKWKKGQIPLGVAYFSLVYSTYTHLFHSYYLFKEELCCTQEMDTTKVWIGDEVIVGKLVVRSFEDHDTIELKEGTKKVSSLLASWHIDFSDRWRIPLLVDDDGVLAVLGTCFLGKDRVAKRALLSPLARKLTTLYSVRIIEG
jgi:tRNA(Ile)-lysidine synthase